MKVRRAKIACRRQVNCALRLSPQVSHIRSAAAEIQLIRFFCFFKTVSYGSAAGPNKDQLVLTGIYALNDIFRFYWWFIGFYLMIS